jgi:hypothetical protein
LDISSSSVVERIARVLAGQRLSSNATGDDPHAATEVDATWKNHREHAIAILKTIREPDEVMERAGDIAIWQRMIAAALGETGSASGVKEEPPAPGTDPLHEGP